MPLLLARVRLSRTGRFGCGNCAGQTGSTARQRIEIIHRHIHGLFKIEIAFDNRSLRIDRFLQLLLFIVSRFTIVPLAGKLRLYKRTLKLR